MSQTSSEGRGAHLVRSISAVLHSFHRGETRRKWTSEAFLVGSEESSPKPILGSRQIWQGFGSLCIRFWVPFTWCQLALLCHFPPPSLRSHTHPHYWLPPRAFIHQRNGPHPRQRTWDWPQTPTLLGFFSPPALFTRSTPEKQWGLSGIYARNSLMKGRDVSQNSARVPDRQLRCMTPSPCHPTPLTSPAARWRLGVAEQGSLEIRCM